VWHYRCLCNEGGEPGGWNLLRGPVTGSRSTVAIFPVYGLAFDRHSQVKSAIFGWMSDMPSRSDKFREFGEFTAFLICYDGVMSG